VSDSAVNKQVVRFDGAKRDYQGLNTVSISQGWALRGRLGFGGWCVLLVTEGLGMRGVWGVVFSAVMIPAVAGCGGGAFEVVPAGGSVQFKGAPVSTGSITLVPVSAAGEAVAGKDLGKPAKAELKPDGTFELSTYGQFDGAVPGRHKVIYEGPEGEEEAEETEVATGDGETETADPNARKARKNAKPRMSLQVQEGTEVEVKTGVENRFVIELVEGPAIEEEPVE